jgi:hypothetical protein
MERISVINTKITIKLVMTNSLIKGLKIMSNYIFYINRHKINIKI